MLKKMLVITVAAFLTTLALAAQPDKGADKKQQPASHSNPTVVLPAPAHQDNGEADKGKTTTNTPHWYTTFENPDGMLVIVGIITCAVIGWQSLETRKSAQAGQRAAKAALEQIRSMKDKERSRFQVELDRFQWDTDRKDVSGQRIVWRLNLHGPTEAFNVKMQIFACIDDPEPHGEYQWGLWPIELPTVITPSKRDHFGETWIYMTTASGEDVGSWEWEEFNRYLSGPNRRCVYCAGKIEWTDVFGDGWVLPIRRRMSLIPKGLGVWYYDGDNQEQKAN
jgi:hypothetical protein